MKILVVSPKFHPVIGGGETFVLNSIEQLHAAGQEVAIAAAPHEKRNVVDYDFPVYEVLGLSDTELDIVRASDGVFKLIESFRPDIIHVHGYFALLTVGLCNKTTPVVASIHSTPVWGQRIVGGMSGFEQERIFAEQILSFTHPSILTGANYVYTEAAEKLMPLDSKVVYFPYPILSTFYDTHDRNIYRNLFKLQETDVLITVPSRIIERKGIREAVLALHKLPDNYYLCLPSAINPLDEAYWQSIKDTEEFSTTAHRIIIPAEEVHHDHMPLLLAASDIITMPSYYEGAPVATVEAMASRRPFIGADSQGINGFIRHMENGILVPQKSITELAEAIRTLASNLELQRKLTSVAANDVSSLSWKQQLPILTSLYETAIKEFNSTKINKI